MGIATVVVATTAFAGLARQVAQSQGTPEARIAVVAHPLGGIEQRGVLDRAESAVEAVLSLLTTEG